MTRTKSYRNLPLAGHVWTRKLKLKLLDKKKDVYMFIYIFIFTFTFVVGGTVAGEISRPLYDASTDTCTLR